ncbi:MAG TPA: hypothetical protein VEQ61_09290 [Thermoleophilaceae bacterium]|nr:hypothetical protein [Thermoleophilaceae bacterium]
MAASCAVTPAVPFKHSSFEGFEVISHIPDNPRGLVYVFHGTLGSASFAEKVETMDVLNRLARDGYGFVSTESTERAGDRRWNVSDGSLATNADLARLVRLHASLVAMTPLSSATPVLGIGMSNGARFVTLWGQAWKNAGYPVRAIWASMGRIATPVSGAGQLTVPTVFSTAVNDFTSRPGPIILDFNDTRAAGTPAELYVSQERKLSAERYSRIPGVDMAEAQQIREALTATGVWNAEGTRVVADIQQAVAQADTVRLPASVAGVASEVRNQTALQLAVHQFTAEYAGQVAAFFGRYAPR